MPIEFQNIPQDWKQPLYFLEVDPSLAGYPVSHTPCLLIGQKFTTGIAVPNVPIAIGSLAEAQSQFGMGSMLSRMFSAFFTNNFSQEVWGLPLAEPAGAAATGAIVIATPPTQAGTIDLYIAGQHIPVNVAATDTTHAVAANMVAAINASPSTLPVTAALTTSSGASITLTCRWKGLSGNDITLTDSFYGSRGSEVLPPGLTLTYTPMASGTGTPTLTTAISLMGDDPYEYVALPFNDSTSWLAMDAEYGFTDSGRWGWLRQLYGHIFTAYRGTYSGILTWGVGNNSGVISPLGLEPTVLSPVWEVAAAYTAKAGRALVNDPARPLQTLTLDGILPAPRKDRFPAAERSAIAGVGVATQSVSTSGAMIIMRESTSYQFNKYGQGDTAYELVTTLATLAKLFRNQRFAITTKYPRHKLADDGTRFGAGQAIVTPKVIKSELISEYSSDEFNGLVENLAAFKANLIVERDPTNQNRVNVLYPPYLVGQLRMFAVLAQFRLQSAQPIS